MLWIEMCPSPWLFCRFTECGTALNKLSIISVFCQMFFHVVYKVMRTTQRIGLLLCHVMRCWWRCSGFGAVSHSGLLRFQVNALFEDHLKQITVIWVAQLTSRPFVPPSVSLQNNLWKYKSCEKETSSPHICPSLLTSVFLHPITPSFLQSIHQQQWCDVIIMRASLRSSVCLHARPRRVVICLPVCLHTSMYLDLCVCVLNVCRDCLNITNFYFLQEPLTFVVFFICMLKFKKRFF